MAKAKTIYVCGACGHSSPRWLGRCVGCQAWGSLVEERAPGSRSAAKGSARAEAAARVVTLADVPPDAATRLSGGVGELDRVLGGGAVVGGVVLLAGDPGIGKSTLLLQMLGALAARGATNLYVSAEESSAQVALRAKRLAGDGVSQVRVLSTTDLDEVLAAVEAESPRIVVVDSIQTLRATQLESVSGSVSQLREVSTRLIESAKTRGFALFLIGHVTKDGAIAGPKVLEHLVDTVLSFEGDTARNFRLVRSAKNRFGPTHELGVFEMREDGLRPVDDPSRLFVSERLTQAAGSIVVPTAEGLRPLLVEVQALVAHAAYGTSRRVATGVDATRLAMLLAVLDRRAGYQAMDQDVFVSIVGGARIDEPALDLAVCAAVASSLRDRPVPLSTVAFGEVGLTGEVRAVPRTAERLAEARKLGFSRVVAPKSALDQLAKGADAAGLDIVAATDLSSALAAIFA